MKVRTYTLKNDGGVKNSKGDWVFIQATTGDKLIFIDFHPGNQWPHSCVYILVRNDTSNWNRMESWPPDVSHFHTPTLEKVFSQVALLEILLNMAQDDKEVPEEQAESCVAALKDFRKKYNAWKIF
jgi:hypothetical protein